MKITNLGSACFLIEIREVSILCDPWIEGKGFFNGWSPLIEIDLEKIKTSASMLDWIFQLHAKTWTPDESMADLLMFFYVLFHPQSTLCSMGNERGPINPKAVISKFESIKLRQSAKEPE